MWKIIALFFRFRATPDQFPEIIQNKIFEICSREQFPINLVTLRRKKLNYFSIDLLGEDFSVPDGSHPTGWGFSFDSLEID